MNIYEMYIMIICIVCIFDVNHDNVLSNKYFICICLQISSKVLILYLNFSYDTLWYVAPLPIQKLFLIMQKSIQRHKLILGGLFVPSIEGFSTVIKMNIIQKIIKIYVYLIVKHACQ